MKPLTPPITRPESQPVIGIPCQLTYDNLAWPPLNGVRDSYLRAVLDAGGIPLLIPVLADVALAQPFYDRIDGLLLAGGHDVDPQHYGEPHHPQLGAIEPLRDQVELALTRRAIDEGMPLLAICRGVQVLNVALGGTLYQDIPEQLDTTIDHDISTRHAREQQRADWTFVGHDLQLEPDSQLARLLGAERLPINTLHHQALKDVAPELRAVGWSPDGLVEAVEGCNGAFLLGVQCHPEGLYPQADPRWLDVFRGFVAQAAGFRAVPAD